MATTRSGSVKSAQGQAARAARRAASQDWVEALERWGFVARGVLYLIMGWLALRLAMGAGGQATDPVGALRLLAQQPYAKVLLVAMAAGLAGYALWGLVRAVLDPLGKGHDAQGLVARAGYLTSAFSYGVLVIPAVQLLMGRSGGQQAGDFNSITAQLMSKPFGIQLVTLFGAFWIVAGLGQIYTAWNATFMRDLRTRKMSPDERYWARTLGRIGYAARGIVYGMVGIFLIQAATTANPQRAQGFGGVLARLAQGQYGQLVLGAVALGLVLFGIYSILSARWYTMDKSQRG